MENKNNYIIINSESDKEMKFSRGFKILLNIAIFSTLLVSISGLFFALNYKEIINVRGFTVFIYEIIYLIKIFICCIALIVIRITKRPFSKGLLYCAIAVGIFLVILSIAFPILTKGVNRGFQIFSTGKFFIDGLYLTEGLILIIFSKIIDYGFNYQKKDDETI